MHRRAQEAESKAARVWRQNDTDRLWRTVGELRHRMLYHRRGKLLWLDRYRAVASLLPRWVVNWALRRRAYWPSEKRSKT